MPTWTEDELRQIAESDDLHISPFRYASPAEARESLEVFRRRYHEVRPHWALVPAGGGDVLTPADVYVHGQAIQLPKWQGWARAAREEAERARPERASARDGRPRARARSGCLMPVSTLTKSGRTCPVDFGAKTNPLRETFLAARHPELPGSPRARFELVK